MEQVEGRRFLEQRGAANPLLPSVGKAPARRNPPKAASGDRPSQSEAIKQAKRKIAAGADPEVVKERLRRLGYTVEGL